jgi:uncharacterized delta-60 repeat protein
MKKSLIHLFLLVGLAFVQFAQAAPSGQLDPTFGAAGIRTIGFDNPGGNKDDHATAMARAADGRIYLAGSISVAQAKTSIGITRLSPDGAIDTQFGVNGRATYAHPALATAYILDAAFQASGRLVVVGAGMKTGSTHLGFLACGFKPDGTIDTSFGDLATPGCRIIETSGDSNSYAIAMAIQANGRIVMAGQSVVSGLVRATMVRLTGNGKLDESFDFDGVSFPFPGFTTDHAFNDIGLTQDGKLVAAGHNDIGIGNMDFFVARFDQEFGQRDTSFNESGYRIVGFDNGGSRRDVANAVSVLADGRIVLVGEVEVDDGQYRPAVARLNSLGELEQGWNNGLGKRVYDPCAQIVDGCDMRTYDVGVLANDQVIIAGSIGAPGNPATNDWFAMKLLASSNPDNAFGTQLPGQNGMARVAVSARGDAAFRLAMQGNRVVLAGSATPVVATGEDFAIARLDHGIVAPVTVSTSVQGNGQILPAAPQQVPHSSHVSFTITPAANNAIKSVTGCAGALIGNIYTTGPVTQNCTVQAIFAANVTLTYVPGENGVIQGPNPQVIPYNADGSAVTATADTGYFFARWSDEILNINTSNPRTDFDVKEDITVTAIFEPMLWKLFGQPTNAGGKVAPADGKLVTNGEAGHIVIQPDPGFGVASVDGCNGVLVGNAYVVGPMTDNCIFDVTFEPSDATYNLNYEAGLHCTVNGATQQSVKSGFDGSEVVVTSDDGYVFLQWSDGDKNPIRKDTHVFNHISVTAQCAHADAQLYTVTPKFSVGGALSPFVPQLIAENDSAQFKVLPTLGYGIASVSGCDVGSLVGNVYTTAPVQDNCTVEATFEQSNIIYALNYIVDPAEGALVGSANQQVLAGGSGESVLVDPNPGRYFVQWTDGSTDNPRQDTNIFANIDVKAIFALDGQLMVTPIAGVGGTIEPDLIQIVDPGDVVKFTVTPNPFFEIVSVSGCAGSLVGKVYTTGPIVEHCKVKAFFAPTDKTYLLKYAAGPNGSLLGSTEQEVESGGTGQAVTAMPANLHLFLQWSDGSKQNPRIDAGVIADVDVTAQFVPLGSLVVTPVVAGGIGGSFDPALAQVVEEGDVVEFTLNPEPGFAIGTVTGCGGELAGNLYTTAPVNASCTVEATFVPSDETFTLTYKAGPNGLVNGQAAVIQPNVISGGTGQPVEAQPAIGFFFVTWSDGSMENPRTDSNIVGSIDVTAQFAINGSLVVTPVVDGPGGTLDPAIAQAVLPGSVVQFTVSPHPGFAIDQVSGCGGSLEGKLFTTAPVVTNCTVQASFVPSDEMFLLTYLAGPNGSIQGDAEQVVISGGTGESVTAVPQQGYFFVKWSDFPAWLEAERVDSNIISDVTVTATFALDGTPTHIVTATAGEGGGIDPDGEQLVVDGEQLIFTIQPSIGFVIDEVEGCDGSLVDNKYLTAPVTDDCDVIATFLPANGKQFSLTYTADQGGQVNGQAVVQMMVPAGGDGIDVDAQPQAGHFFIQWNDGIGDNPRLDTHVAADIDVIAQFAPDGTPIHIVTPTSGLGGALSPLLPQKIAEGKTVQFTVLPNEGYAVVSVGGTCGGSLINNVYTTQPITQDCTVNAQFAPSDEVFTLKYIAGANGLVNGMQVVEQNVVAGGSGPVVEAQPANGFEFVQWTDGGTDNPRQDMNVTGDIEITAVFAPIGANTFLVTPVVVGGTGGGLAPPVPQVIAEGETAQFTIVPDDGFAFEPIGGTCGGTLEGNVFTTDPVLADCTVEVTFFNDRIFYDGFQFQP